jgi:uncharacterized membrane protein YoaK (UPF0700 family)
MTSTSPPLKMPGRLSWLPRSLIADPRFGPLPGLLLLLTVVTGVVDAISILALGRVFVANMTGNVVFAGFAITGAPGFSLSASLFALAAVALVLAAPSGAAGVTHGTMSMTGGAFGPAITDALAAVLALAIGIQNAGPACQGAS